MKLSQEPALFRPINIRIEHQDELDMLQEIICAVAENSINPRPPVIQAAKDMRIKLFSLASDFND